MTRWKPGRLLCGRIELGAMSTVLIISRSAEWVDTFSSPSAMICFVIAAIMPDAAALTIPQPVQDYAVTSPVPFRSREPFASRYPLTEGARYRYFTVEYRPAPRCQNLVAALIIVDTAITS
jgi:hypothetical protein